MNEYILYPVISVGGSTVGYKDSFTLTWSDPTGRVNEGEYHVTTSPIDSLYAAKFKNGELVAVNA